MANPISSKTITFSDNTKDGRQIDKRWGKEKWMTYVHGYYKCSIDCGGLFSNYNKSQKDSISYICLDRPPSISDLFEFLLMVMRGMRDKKEEVTRKKITAIKKYKDLFFRYALPEKQKEVDLIYSELKKIAKDDKEDDKAPHWVRYFDPYYIIVDRCHGKYPTFSFDNWTIECRSNAPSIYDLLDYLYMIVSGMAKLLPSSRITRDINLSKKLLDIKFYQEFFSRSLRGKMKEHYHTLFSEMYKNFEETEVYPLDDMGEIHLEMSRIRRNFPDRKHIIDDRKRLIDLFTRLSQTENEDEKQRIETDIQAIFNSHHQMHRAMRQTTIEDDQLLSQDQKTEMLRTLTFGARSTKKKSVKKSVRTKKKSVKKSVRTKKKKSVKKSRK